MTRTVFFVAALLTTAAGPTALSQADDFLRGDSNGDRELNIGDALTTLNYLFLGTERPDCLDSLDANDDGRIDIADPVATLGFLFGSSPLPPPNDGPGGDPTLDLLPCEALEGLEPVPFAEIVLECVDLVSVSEFLQSVVDTQEEYDQLIYERFEEPLEDYWNRNYDDVKAWVLERFPGIDAELCERRVEEEFFRVPPFRGTAGCALPEIDFTQHTLLGQGIGSAGCEAPDQMISILKDEENERYIYRLDSVRNGHCKAYFLRNSWVLVPKIPASYTVTFEKRELGIIDHEVYY